MKKILSLLAWAGIFLLLAWSLAPREILAETSTPPNLKVAFIGDQGLGEEPKAVLTMIKAEGADLVIHSGDFDYADDPAAWDGQINGVLGPNFPYIGSIGNHDVKM